MTSSSPHLLEMKAITKKFGAITALDHVDLTLSPGEVLGVVGDNGAGKSTLMKVLSGLYHPTEGEILLAGQPITMHSPKDARDVGIEMVYQDLALAGNLPVHENIYLGREPGRERLGFTIVDQKKSRDMAKAHLERLHISLKSVDQKVEQLSGGQAQAVAIARATAFDARIVIMDEPTAALAIKEVGKVLDLIKRLKDHGTSVILISHRMDDVFFVCDRVMALFHGRNFDEATIGNTNRNEVIGWIMGTKGHTEDLAHDRI
ncbi:ATP-binding cassette domain-containing protein [Hoeflea prorocentri]|uniref:ATP-binding cassette domain-containing protein n=1 Tax=Hoeflea prorocentri TaxID=1922333 RepID=A0A9X3UJ97_9HYPH|nr:ATP-binding cassette domain-containing protein [Hoeflea prorocentri]MCY6379746.1 ATP-binding cassette domain-containing protein [Hoeflea prorocentri]MDA5397546.1 ATP-binding cassette domain-containing protein [Hoeflea prorocentri]